MQVSFRTSKRKIAIYESEAEKIREMYDYEWTDEEI